MSVLSQAHFHDVYIGNCFNWWRFALGASKNTHTDNVAQIDKFKQAARDLECDDDPERFNERIKKVVKHKRVEKPE